MRYFYLFAALLLFSQCDLLDDSGNTDAPTHTTTNDRRTDPKPDPVKPSGEEFSEDDLAYRGKDVVLTKHARCRMDCREIDAFEIQEVIDQNNINERKTQRDAKPCPSIAYEGDTRDGQRVRVIVGDCSPAKIITVIDLKNEFECTCD